MAELIPFMKIALYAMMLISVIAALGAILLPNLFHSAICFVGVLFGIAAVFIAVGAEFLAIVQILIYVGAVMTLVIFAIMMTSGFSDDKKRSHNSLGIPVLIAGTTFFLILMKLIMNTPWVIQKAALEAHVSPAALGESIMTTYVFPFEVVGVLLTAALIGAIVITRKEKRA